MANPIRPGDLTGRDFRHAFRGFYPEEVTAFLGEVAARLAELEEHNAELEARLSATGRRDLEAEFEAVARDVGQILQTAREAAEGIRERAAAEAARWRSEALAAAETLSREAQADAENLRGDSWTTSEALLKQVLAEAENLRRTSDREALATLGEAERDAHRRVAAARREAEELIRTAKMESERLLVEARTRHDEIVDSARRSAEAAQERARALEERRNELLGELESVRATLSGLESRLEERREALGTSQFEEATVKVVLPPAPEEEEEVWEDGETIRILPARKPEPTSAAEVGIDALTMADEVRRIRATAETAAVAATTTEAAAPVVEPATPAPTPEPELPDTADEMATGEAVPAAAQPSTPGEDDLAVLFRSLRTGAAAAVAEPEPEPEAAPAAAPASRPEPEPHLTAEEAFSVRERLLLPITNRVLRDIKRELTEAQNVALEALRLDEGPWEPDPAELQERFHGDLVIVAQESFAAGYAGVREMTGIDAGRAKPHAGDIPDASPEFAAALAAALEHVLHDGAEDGPRHLATGLSRVYRAWRTDEAERRVRELALAGYHRGVLRALEAGGGVEHVRWIVAGRGCSTCREAREASPVDVGEAFPGAELPPAHAGCACTVIPA